MASSKEIRFNTELQWVYHNRINTNFGGTKYSLDCINLSSAAVKAMKDMGLEPRVRSEKPEKGTFITGKSSKPIPIVDKNGLPIENVGNGSKAIVTMGTYFAKKLNKNLPAIRKVVVTELVEFQETEVVDVDGDSIEEMVDDVL
jgi:protein-tyrosine-phosphatase